MIRHSHLGPLCLGFCALLSSAIASPVDAQSLHVETFTADEGLPSAQIYDLAQTADGRLWIVHRGGVSVFDGRRFKSYSTADGLPDFDLGAITLGPDGRPWLASRWSGARVYRLRGERWEAFPTPPDVNDVTELVTSILVTGSAERPQVQVGSASHGLRLWHGERWHRKDEAAGLASNHVTDLAMFGERLAVATRGGLCFVDASRVACDVGRRVPRLADPILALHVEDRPGASPRLWILAESFLGYLEAERLTLVADELEIPSFPGAVEGALELDQSGDLYFGTEAQAFHLDRERMARSGARPDPLSRREGLVNEGMTALLLDREANVWIGSMRGLSRIESRRFLSYDRRHGLLEDEVVSILELAPDRLLLGHNGGLTWLEGGEVGWTLAFDETSLDARNSSRVIDMARAPDGRVWLAAHRRGLLELHADRSLRRVSLAEEVFAVEYDLRGRLWVSAGKELFVRQMDGRFRSVVPEPGRGSGADEIREPDYYRWLAAAPDGRFLISTRRGLLWHDGRDDLDAGWHRATAPTAASNTLYGILVRPGGGVWVGTGAGLYELAGESLRRPRQDGLLSDRAVYSLLDDGDRTWLGTDDGVFLWDGLRLRQLTLEHGLAGRETNRGAALVDHRGRVWIGTVRGLSVYEARHDYPPSALPTVELATIEVNGAPRAAGVDLRLTHDENNLNFHFDTVAFSRAQPVGVRYRLDPFDEDWRRPVSPEATEATYTNIPPGTYRFEIAAGWEGGDWGEPVGSGRIEIAAPLWRRGDILSAAGLLGAFLLTVAHRWRLSVVHRRNLELESVVAELRRLEGERGELIHELEDRNAELERFVYTVSHDLKSPLVTVKGFLGLLENDITSGDAERTRGDIAQIKAATNQMSRLLSELLELSRIGRVVGPRLEIDLGEVAREARDLVLGDARAEVAEVEIDPRLPVVWGDRTRLLEVFQNLLENAVKYAGDAPRPRIEIGVREGAGSVAVIFVKDNGAGIEPRYHEKIFGLFERLETAPDGTGIGLAIVRRIIEVHGGRVWVESEGPGCGSTFCFTLPDP